MSWTKEDFESTSAPYEEIYQIEDPFQRQQAINQTAAQAKAEGVRNFLKLYQMFEKSVRRPRGCPIVNNSTDFDNQPLELDSGDWRADETGVYKEGTYGERVIACPHPVMPVERLVNIDTHEEKLRLAYRKGKAPWRTIIVDKRVLASATKVTELAGSGISVTSDNAKQFIRYIFELETLNYDRLPERKSIGRLGHIREAGFSPYVAGLVFDGDASFQALFRSVTAHGVFQGAEESWAVENALPPVKAAATGVIPGNREDGVARFLLALDGPVRMESILRRASELDMARVTAYKVLRFLIGKGAVQLTEDGLVADAEALRGVLEETEGGE